MATRIHPARLRAVVCALAISLGLAAAPAFANEEIDVVGGNSSNSLMFWLNYSGEAGGIDAAVTLNDDANAYPNLNSFTFLPDSCGAQRTDILAASTNAGRIVRYSSGVGSGVPFCGASGQPACPARPVGLSTGPGHIVSVATSGAAGSTPGVFAFAPADDDCSKFKRTGGPLSAAGVTRLRSIVDTAFVRVDAGDLSAGELLVLAGNPAMIVRVKPDELGKAAVSGEVFADSLEVFAGSYRRATPTGLAIVPGEIPNVLVTLSTGVVVNFYFDDDAATWGATTLDSSSFPNPRGIAAGTRDGTPYIVVSEQNRGRYIRAELEGAGNGLGLVKPFREIVTPVGAPEGVAIKHAEGFSVSVTEGQCFDVDPGPNAAENDTGCDILGAIQVHLSSYGEDRQPGDRITARLKLLEDTRDDASPASLGLGGAFDNFADFSIPPHCRGFELDDGKRYVVVLDMGMNFELGAATFIKVTEQVQSLLGVGDCTEESTRIYHRPGDSPGELLDKTFYCSNPSRSILDVFSPVVLCFDPLHLERKDALANTTLQAAIGTRRDEVNDEIRRRIDSLKGIVEELRMIGDAATPDPGFRALAAELNTHVTGRTNPNTSWPQIRYMEASCSLDKAAVAIFDAKQPLFRDRMDLTPDKTIYARALSETLGLAFYISEVGALEEYRPPFPLCDPGLDEQNPRPELPDVACRPWPDQNPWCVD